MKRRTSETIRKVATTLAGFTGPEHSVVEVGDEGPIRREATCRECGALASDGHREDCERATLAQALRGAMALVVVLLTAGLMACATMPDPVVTPPAPAFDRPAAERGCYDLWHQEAGLERERVTVALLEECVGWRMASVPETSMRQWMRDRASQWQPVPAPVTPRRGIVRLEGGAFADDDGPFNALGATLFWLAWGVEHDRDRLEANLTTLASAGVDYVRALAVVGPGSGWADRTIDPRSPGWRTAIEQATDLVAAHGMRVQWTIFGGIDTTPSADDRRRVVETVLEVVAARQEKVFAVELANEANGTGWDGPAGLAELRALGRLAADRLAVPVALTSPIAEAVCATYAGAGVDFATMHYDRDTSFGDGVWRPVRQPWGYPGEYDATCGGELPRAVSNNEPIGPQASVTAEADPLRLVMGYATTFVSGNGAYVFHAGPGIRGGGAEDVRRGRVANYGDLDPALLAGLTAARRYLPAGIGGWARHNAAWATAPLQGFQQAIEREDLIRAYMATSGDQIVAVLLGLRGEARATATAAMTIEVRDPVTGTVLETLTLAAGEAMTVRARRDRDGLVLLGRRR